MADWRYEGIICGYITLYRSTGQVVWLERAGQAGDDLVSAQLPSGKFRNSAFQQGPMEGGTPHESAVDVALLELAQVLRESGDEAWRTYFAAACRNIEGYLIGELWDGRGFCDQPWNQILVPNKNATIAEALILFESLSGRDMSMYLDKISRVILSSREETGPRSGATIHLGTGSHRLAIGIYTARSMCGLLRMYERDPDEQLLQVVDQALHFLRGLYTPQGLYFGRYTDGGLIANPRIIAGSGDVLRLMIWSRKYGIASDADINTLVELLVNSQFPSGSIPTAFGFAQRGGRRAYEGLPEFRDLLPVVGWCDKAFRALTMLVAEIESNPHDEVHEVEVECVWNGNNCRLREDAEQLQLEDQRRRQVIYEWKKGTCYPSIYQL